MRFAPLRSFLATLGLVATAGASPAQGFLEEAHPAAGTSLAKSPDRLVLVFAEPVEGAGLTVHVLDAAGNAIASLADAGAVVQWATVSLPLPPLAAGQYRVAWKAGGTGRPEGDYGFTVL